MLDTFSDATFAPLLGQQFQLSPAPGQPIRLIVLITVEALGGPTQSGRQPFSLIFADATPGAALPQHIYSLTHAVLGQLELFLVPIGPVPGGMGYQAIFS
ncbi:MAG: hypothetical protein H7Z42_15995 [Roseiflexaceae bacterium]|nr:hypothetical protein [Roseiflexaceae bacterium]